jgi:hypothetical protein
MVVPAYFAVGFLSLPFGFFQSFAPKQTAPPMIIQTPPTVQQDGGNDLCAMQNTAFQVGEKLTYKIYYNLNFLWMPAGEVTFTTEDGGSNRLHIAAVGRTYSSYEWFFKVRDRYETYVDKNTLVPTLSIRDIHEGNFNLFHRQTFNYASNTVVVDAGETRNNTNPSTHKFTGCVDDIISVIYRARNMNPNDYKKDDKIGVRVFMDKQIYNVKVHFKGKEANKSIKELGIYNIYKFTPEMRDSEIFKDATGMNVYCSDDKNRIPLLIESPLSVGTIKVVLSKYEGLRNPMTAKVK